MRATARQKILLILLALFPASRAEAVGGIDTPTGISNLPFQVQGIQGMNLVQVGSGGVPYLSVTGSASIGSNAVPQRRLDIANGLTAPGIGSMRVFGYQAGYEVYNTAGTADWYFANNDADSNSLYIGRGYGPAQALTPNIVITQSGLIGLGTTVPIARLSAQYDDNARGTGLALVNTNTGINAQSKIQLTAGNYTSYIYQQGAALFFWAPALGGYNFYVNNGATSAMTMQSNGTVGIDNTNPAYPLDVKRVGSSGGVVFISDTTTNRSIILTTDDGSGNASVGITNGGQYWNAGVGSNGLYFIGTPGSWGLQINLLGLLTVRLGLLQLSDERLKKDITPISGALGKLEKIRGVTFHWRDPKQEKREQMGVIAQDVEKVFPDAVRQDDDGYKTVNYPILVGPLIEAVKELKTDNDDLRTQIQEIKKQITAQAKD